jgi:predicted O-linked N-acetylglucosamine transferase (SPINDLY family)
MSELGRHDEALECYARTLEVNPAHAEAHCNVGVIKKYRGDLVGAIDAYEMCLAVDPNHALGRGNLSIALGDKATELKATGDVELAIRTYERALTLDPNSAEATYNLGVAQAEIGELDRATIAYENTLRLRPHCAEAWNNLGVLHRERNNVERAMECYQRAIAINPSFAQPLNNLGVVYTMQGQARLALEALQRAVASAPTYAVAHNNLGVLLRDTGDIPEALEAYNECARQSPDHRNAEQNYLLGLNYVLPGERTEVCAAHADWGVRFVETFVAQNGGPLPPRRLRESDWRAGERGAKAMLRSESIRSFGLVDSDTDDSNSETEDESVDDDAEAKGESNDANTNPHTDTNGADALQKTVTKKGSARTKRRLIVGYVTPDAYAHSVSYFAAAPLSHHDPSRVKVIVYSATPRSDAQTQMLKDRVAAIDGTWRDVVNLSERQLADAIRADGVDVLVELTGHTANNRLGTMALKPAPVQVTWIGYPNSTGLPTIDYRVTDAVCDPVDTAQTFTEHLARLPGCFLSYTPSTEAGPVAPAPCLGSGYVTFGCFNTLAKVTPDVRNAWARIMRSVPNSRLLLKAKPFACQTIQRRFLSAMEQLGVESWRIDLFPLVGGTGAHLSMYGMVDMALDTFPYAGTTTTCESLWMGVPVLTAIGECHAHNVGASLLNAVGGMEDFVAVDTDDYVERAVRLANDPERLATTRMGLRSKMAASELCDGRTFMRGVETAYLKMWRRWCRSEVEREDDEEKARRRKEEKMDTGGGTRKKKGSGSECSTDDQRSPTASR